MLNDFWFGSFSKILCFSIKLKWTTFDVNTRLTPVYGFYLWASNSIKWYIVDSLGVSITIWLDNLSRLFGIKEIRRINLKRKNNFTFNTVWYQSNFIKFGCDNLSISTNKGRIICFWINLEIWSRFKSSKSNRVRSIDHINNVLIIFRVVSTMSKH